MMFKTKYMPVKIKLGHRRFLRPKAEGRQRFLGAFLRNDGLDYTYRLSDYRRAVRKPSDFLYGYPFE